MTVKKTMAAVAVLVLIGVSAGLLATFKARQKVGKPGVKLVDKPMLDEHGKPFASVSVGLPEKILNYSSTNLFMFEEELRYLPKDTTYGRRRYLHGGDMFADMTVVLMGTDRTSIHKPQFCLTSQGWKIERSEMLTVPMARPHPYELPVMKLTTAARPLKLADGSVRPFRAMYVYWFVSEKRLTSDHKARMWGMVEDLVMTGVLPRWAYVSCLTFCPPGREEATYQWLKELIAAGVPEFQMTTMPPTETVPTATASR
jgi:hypothetical protein